MLYYLDGARLIESSLSSIAALGVTFNKISGWKGVEKIASGGYSSRTKRWKGLKKRVVQMLKGSKADLGK